MTKGVKHPPPLRIDMDFNEALERFIQTKPAQVDAVIKRSKTKKPPGSKKKKQKKPGSKNTPPGTLDQSSVVSLRDRRMRKRNYGR